jgi:hypothetical protein
MANDFSEILDTAPSVHHWLITRIYQFILEGGNVPDLADEIIERVLASQEH